MIKEASENSATDPHSTEKLPGRLVHVTTIKEAELVSKYADAVVQGIAVQSADSWVILTLRALLNLYQTPRTRSESLRFLGACRYKFTQ